MAPLNRPLKNPKHPIWLKIKRIGMAGLSITAIVIFVASLPVLVLSFWIEEEVPTSARGLEAPADRTELSTEEILIPSGEIDLYSTLFLPAGRGPYPVMVAVHGSGRARGRDMEQAARFFANNGVAVLVYDKRGVGGSGGEYSAVGTLNSHFVLTQLANDTRSVIYYLKNRKEIRHDRIGLLGFSQAGWIVPIAAVSDDSAFMVLISGPTVTVGEEIYYSELTGDDAGNRTGLGPEEVSKRLAEYPGPAGFDPLPFLAELDKPGFWVYGGQDLSIPVKESVRILDRLIQEENKPYEYKVFFNGDHGLRNPISGERIPFFPEILDWLQRQRLID